MRIEGPVTISYLPVELLHYHFSWWYLYVSSFGHFGGKYFYLEFGFLRETICICRSVGDILKLFDDDIIKKETCKWRFLLSYDGVISKTLRLPAEQLKADVMSCVKTPVLTCNIFQANGLHVQDKEHVIFSNKWRTKYRQLCSERIIDEWKCVLMSSRGADMLPQKQPLPLKVATKSLLLCLWSR